MIYLPQKDTASIETALNVIGMITRKTASRFSAPRSGSRNPRAGTESFS